MRSKCGSRHPPPGHNHDLKIYPVPQAALAVPGADKQQQVAEAHRRTSVAMLALRATLRDEHYYLLQVRARCLRMSIIQSCAVSAQYTALSCPNYPERLAHE